MALGFSKSKWVDWPLRHGKSIADYYFGVILNRDHAFIISDGSAGALAEQLEQAIDDHPYLLLLYDPNEESLKFADVAAALEANYAACDRLIDEEDLIAQRYVYRTLTCDRDYEPISYENGIRIIDKFADFDGEGELFRIVTGWEVADEAQLDQYQHLISDSHARVAKRWTIWGRALIQRCFEVACG